MRLSPIPGGLGEAFTLSSARESGVSASRLRARDLERPFHGVRAVTAFRDERMRQHPVIELARSYIPRMGEHEFFSHVTAALIWGLPLPSGCIVPGVLHVSVVAPRRAPRCRGVIGHQARAASTSVCRHPSSGMLVSSPACTWVALAPLLEHPYDVVAVADAVVHIPRMPGGFARGMHPPLATVEQLEACLRAGRRVGIGTLREALPRVRTGAASRPETWARLTLIDAGLPEPVLDHDVFDEHGLFLACVDMAYPELRIAIEYEGDHHRSSPEQWAKDVDRVDKLVEHGWRVIRVTKRLLFGHPREFVRRVAAARASLGA